MLWLHVLYHDNQIDNFYGFDSLVWKEKYLLIYRSGKYRSLFLDDIKKIVIKEVIDS